MFKRLLTIAAVAATLVASEAGCVNNCNGHGTCGAFDRCSCHAAFTGSSDCSARICPQGQSWTKPADGLAHEYEECSGRGTCDRTTGSCECADGFTGHACQRTTCSNDCSGHGKCLVLARLDSTYTGWDSHQIQGCKCDAGYEGHDCRSRMCPRGDDPLTLNGVGGSQVDEVQTCTITDTDGTPALSGTFVIKFVDWKGQAHTSRALPVGTVTALQIKEALLSFPNNVIPDVTVGTPTIVASTSTAFTVTFSSSVNSGTNNLLSIDTEDHTAHGHHTIHKLVGATATSVTATCTVTTAGTEENSVCAGRGTCNSEKGQCTCHQGFTGVGCEKQSALQ